VEREEPAPDLLFARLHAAAATVPRWRRRRRLVLFIRRPGARSRWRRGNGGSSGAPARSRRAAAPSRRRSSRGARTAGSTRSAARRGRSRRDAPPWRPRRGPTPRSPRPSAQRAAARRATAAPGRRARRARRSRRGARRANVMMIFTPFSNCRSVDTSHIDRQGGAARVPARRRPRTEWVERSLAVVGSGAKGAQ
jgi:hypothetical protein